MATAAPGRAPRPTSCFTIDQRRPLLSIDVVGGGFRTIPETPRRPIISTFASRPLSKPISWSGSLAFCLLLLLTSTAVVGTEAFSTPRPPPSLVRSSSFRSGSLTPTFLVAGGGVDLRTTTAARSRRSHNPVLMTNDPSPSPSTADVDVEADLEVVRVDLSDGRDYPIYIGTDLSNPRSAELLNRHVVGSQILLVTNDTLEKLGYLERYRSILSEDDSKRVETLVLPDGEEHKTMDVLQLILDKALELNLDRKCTFVALGGGVIGDMVGFAAAIYQRGVNFIQIPTTVMAMVDSSVGGKTGVNHPLGKNMIGAFHQPQCVFIDTETLSTLPDRELRSGVSEIVKYGLIRDADFFTWQESNVERLLDRDPSALRYAVRRSCENKADVVKADEKESGLRATLNLGHTFGHAIENGSGYGTWLHGEAVAIGTAMATTMSARMGWIDDGLAQRVYSLLERAKLPVDLPVDSPMTEEAFRRLMSVDKKVADGRLRLILLTGDLGNCVFTGEFDEGAMIDTIRDFVAECSSRARDEKQTVA